MNIKKNEFILCPPFWNKMPPLGLAVLYSYMLNNGIHVSVRDLNAEILCELPSNIKEIDINQYLIENFDKYFDFYLTSLSKDIHNINEKKICFSVFESNKHISSLLAKKIKQKYNNIKIIFGGPEVLYEYNRGNREPFSDVADVAVIGEGESVLFKMLDDKSVVSKTNKNLISFDCFNLNLYKRKGFLPLLFSRGCINKCRFCVERLLRKGFICRGAKKVVLEIENYIKKYNVKNFIFHDSLINADLVELEKFCDLILSKKIQIKWEAQCYIRNDMDEGLLSKMKESGCYNLFIGVENFSDKVLDYMDKGYNKNDIIAFLTKLKNVGLHSELSMIIGSKAEGKNEFKENLDFIENNDKLISKIAQINALKVLPGTDIVGVEESVAQSRIKEIICLLEKKGIGYTEAFVNNL